MQIPPSQPPTPGEVKEPGNTTRVHERREVPLLPCPGDPGRDLPLPGMGGVGPVSPQAALSPSRPLCFHLLKTVGGGNLQMAVPGAGRAPWKVASSALWPLCHLSHRFLPHGQEGKTRPLGQLGDSTAVKGERGWWHLAGPCRCGGRSAWPGAVLDDPAPWKFQCEGLCLRPLPTCVSPPAGHFLKHLRALV